MSGSVITVAHVITKLELGGAQLNTLHTVEHLDRLRFSPYLLCGPGGPLRSKLAEEERLIVVPALGREIRPVRDLQALTQLVRLFRRIQPRIVHTHSSKAGILGRLAARLAGVPIVIHSVHGFPFSSFQPFLKRNFYRLAETCCRRLTRHTVFVSQSDLDLARRWKLAAPEHSLIRSGFPQEKFLGRRDTRLAKADFNLPADAFVCGVVAPFKPQKGLRHLAAIASIVIGRDPSVRFLVAGDGEGRGELEADLRRRGITDNFRLPGFIPDIENAMDAMDIGVSTALWEGVPQSLVQLRLKGKAVVASDIPGNREVIRDNENGFLRPVADHEAFAAAILELAGDAALRLRLGSFPAEDFSEWSDTVLVARQEDLYQRLVLDSWIGG